MGTWRNCPREEGAGLTQRGEDMAVDLRGTTAGVGSGQVQEEAPSSTCVNMENAVCLQTPLHGSLDASWVFGITAWVPDAGCFLFHISYFHGKQAQLSVHGARSLQVSWPVQPHAPPQSSLWGLLVCVEPPAARGATVLGHPAPQSQMAPRGGCVSVSVRRHCPRPWSREAAQPASGPQPVGSPPDLEAARLAGFLASLDSLLLNGVLDTES